MNVSKTFMTIVNMFLKPEKRLTLIWKISYDSGNYNGRNWVHRNFFGERAFKKRHTNNNLGKKKIENLDHRKLEFFDNANCHYISLSMEDISNLPAKLKLNKIEILEDCVFYNQPKGTAKNLSDLDIKVSVS